MYFRSALFLNFQEQLNSLFALFHRVPAKTVNLTLGENSLLSNFIPLSLILRPYLLSLLFLVHLTPTGGLVAR